MPNLDSDGHLGGGMEVYRNKTKTKCRWLEDPQVDPVSYVLHTALKEVICNHDGKPLNYEEFVRELEFLNVF